MTLEKYIESIDGHVLEVTNPYELTRFLTDTGVTCVVYNGKKGINFSNQTAEEIYDKWNKGHIETEAPSSKFKAEKRKIRKLLKSFGEDHIKPLYKFVCDEMGYKKTLNLTGINEIEELRDIWKVIKQYEKLFAAPTTCYTE